MTVFTLFYAKSASVSSERIFLPLYASCVLNAWDANYIFDFSKSFRFFCFRKVISLDLCIFSINGSACTLRPFRLWNPFTIYRLNQGLLYNLQSLPAANCVTHIKFQISSSRTLCVRLLKYMKMNCRNFPRPLIQKESIRFGM